MSNDTIRVGVIGAGTNTVGKHIPGLQAIDGVEVVSVCNRSRESSERVAKQFGISTVYSNWAELIEADDTDAIVIGTWPYMHCTLVLAALAAGKHVMTEARMAMNAEEAYVMRNVAQEHPELVAQIVPSPMTLWADKTIQRHIANGYVGDILSVELRASGNDFLDFEGPIQWRQDYDLSGLNIMSMGIWYEAMLRWVGEATSVIAQGKTFVKMRHDSATNHMRVTRVPEHIDVIMDLACGAQGYMMVSSVQGFGGVADANIYGSEGTLRISGGALYGARRGDSDLQEIDIPDTERGGWRVEEEFIGAIRGEEAITHTTFDTGVKYMEFTEAVNRSMAEGKAISIPL